MYLKAMDLNGLGIKLETLFLVGEKLLYIFALITLKLDHLSHLTINDNGAIASELLLDDLEDLFLIEFLWKTLDSGQSLTTIALLDTNVYVILGLLCLSCIFVRFCERVKRSQIFDARHRRYFEFLGVGVGGISKVVIVGTCGCGYVSEVGCL